MTVKKVDIAKCPACGKLFGKIIIEAEEAVPFKRGPRAGEIKEIATKKMVIDFGDCPADTINVTETTEEEVYDNGMVMGTRTVENKRTLLECPACHAIYGEFDKVYVRVTTGNTA